MRPSSLAKMRMGTGIPILEGIFGAHWENSNSGAAERDAGATDRLMNATAVDRWRSYMDQCTLGAVCRRPETRGLRAQTKILPLERVLFQRNFKKSTCDSQKSDRTRRASVRR
jgi:hypothetical protein